MLSKDQEMLIVTRVVQERQRLKEEIMPEMVEQLYIIIDKAIAVEVIIVATRGNILNERRSLRRNLILIRVTIITNLSNIIRNIRRIIKSIIMCTSTLIIIKNTTIRSIIIHHHGHITTIRQYFIIMILVNSIIIVEGFTGIIGNMDII